MRDQIARLRGAIYSLWYGYFRKNVSIGTGLRIYKKLRISGSGRVDIGRNFVVDGICGDRSQYVTLDVLHPDSVIRIGNNARFHAARISAKFKISIGDDVLIEESGVIDTDFHSIEKKRENSSDENAEKCSVSIGDRVSIGSRSFVTKGLTIGDDVIVAPGSVVATSVKACMRVCGNPARPL